MYGLHYLATANRLPFQHSAVNIGTMTFGKMHLDEPLLMWRVLDSLSNYSP